jgi:hypothetical protein
MTPGNPCTICKSEDDQKNEKNNSSNHKDQPFEMLHFLFYESFACCNVVAENTIFKSPKTQIETHHTKPMI